MSLLQQFQTDSSGEDSKNNAEPSKFAGTILCTSSIDFGISSCKCFRSSIDLWIIDSGASNHMTYNKSSLTNIQTLPYLILVSLPNGYKVKVTEYGDVHISSKMVLNKVLQVPSFKYNLISVQSLVSSMKCILSFTDTTCLLQAPSMKRPQEVGSSKDGIYYMCGRCLNDTTHTSDSVCNCISHSCRCYSFPTSSCNESSVKQSREVPVIFDSSSTNNTDVLNNYASLESLKDGVDLLWHNRLGHVPFVKMRNIPTIPIKFSAKQPFTCTICPMARQVRLSFTLSTTHSKTIFDLLHIVKTLSCSYI